MSDHLFSPDGRNLLLKTARHAVEAAAARESAPDNPIDHPELQAHMGCFVTLKNGEELRGCIGQFEADVPLYQTVRAMARAAVTQDFRFADNPVTAEEVPQLTIEISVLTPMKKCDNPREEIELGKHGIYIRKGHRGGTFLPQVAIEHNMSFDEFLGSCCSHKAGLAPDAWEHDPEVQVFTYEAVIVHESDGS